MRQNVVWHTVRVSETERHTPTLKSTETPPPPPRVNAQAVNNMCSYLFRGTSWYKVQSNLSITDTKETEISVRIKEVSVLEK